MSDDERFSAPEFDCDVIMKGGITSGIVYPPALAEIATDHRLHGVGGTSAGAIAAGAAAAAELGRNSATGGFARLEQLPDELKQVDSGGRTKLFRLFQAQPETRSTFDLIWNFRKRSRWGRIIGLLVDVARMSAGLRPIWTPAIIAVTVVVSAAIAVIAGPVSLVLGVPLVIVGIIVAGAVRLLHVVPVRLADNAYGLCSGETPADSDDPALTDWLYEQIQCLAGRYDEHVDEETRATPVTFGELADHDIDLVVLTTNVSRGTSETIPFRDEIWAYDPVELGKFFPDDVMTHLASAADQPSDPEQRERLEELNLKPLPSNEDLPIIVAVRMSLSFPVLLSAIPLYGYTPRRSGDEWLADYPKNWFSDGGITSNLPVHMFDAVVPNRPTYGINLAGGAEEGVDNPAVNVWRPITARQGALPPTSQIGSIVGLLGAVFDTMQNWSDNDNSRAVGFRDRICTVRLGESEGGMNLDMPPTTIEGLIARGACAGENLASIRRGELTCRVGDPPVGREADIEANQWTRHRWIRFRMAISGVAQLLQGLDKGWVPTDGSPGYRELSESVTPTAPTWQSYRSDWSGVRADGYRQTLDAEFAKRGLSDEWLNEADPSGIAVTFAPDQRPGTVLDAGGDV